MVIYHHREAQGSLPVVTHRFHRIMGSDMIRENSHRLCTLGTKGGVCGGGGGRLAAGEGDGIALVLSSGCR